MGKRVSVAALGVALGLVAGGKSLSAQDRVPTVSQDTSKAAKVRADTLSARDTTAQGYRARLSGNCVQIAAGDTSAARAASRDTTARDTTARDTTALAAINDSVAAQATRDSLAAIRSAEAAGVYRAPTPPPAADSTAVACDSTAIPAQPDSISTDSTTSTDSTRIDRGRADTTRSTSAVPSDRRRRASTPRR